MAKIIDDNGFWLVKSNPISKEGVFPYLGKSISPELEPEKIYNVFRSFDELSDPDTLKSFDGVPFINDHEMLGEGFTRYDDRPAEGVLMNPTAANGIISGDLKIFSESLKDLIAGGKKELSLGYRCEYQITPGEWNGIRYDAVQRNIRGNHIALVDRGRMGNDVRVYDGITCDAVEITEIMETVKQSNKGVKTMADENKKPETGDEGIDKRKLIDEIGGILKDKISEELWRTVVGKVEKVAYSDSESGKATDGEGEGETNGKKDPEGSGEGEGEGKKAEDKGCKDEFFDAPKAIKLINKMKADGKISEETAKELLTELEEGHYRRGTGADSATGIIDMIDRRNSLRAALADHIGDFACDGMTEAEVAAYGCKKLGIACDQGSEVATIRGYLAGCRKSQKQYSMDADVKAAKPGLSPFLKKMINQ